VGSQCVIVLLDPSGKADLPDPVEQRSADVQLVERLRVRGFAGPEYDRFEERLARYGFQMIGTWVRSRRIFALCAEKKIKVARLAPDEVWSDDDVEELVKDTVARALVLFERDGLHSGGWRPDGRASLATYFLEAACLTAFAEVYRRRYGGRLGRGGEPR
jgi:hypothetical protein